MDTLSIVFRERCYMHTHTSVRRGGGGNDTNITAHTNSRSHVTKRPPSPSQTLKLATALAQEKRVKRDACVCALYNHIITVESELMTRLAFLGACTVEYVEKVYHILFKGCQLNLVIIQRGKIKKKVCPYCILNQLYMYISGID